MAYNDFTLEAAVETLTKGTEWMFLKLEEQRLSVDLMFYPIAQCDQILGILSSMVEQKA